MAVSLSQSDSLFLLSQTVISLGTISDIPPELIVGGIKHDIILFLNIQDEDNEDKLKRT